VNLPQGHAVVQEGVLYYERPQQPTTWEPKTLAEGQNVSLPDGGELRLSRVTLGEAELGSILAGKVDPRHQAFLSRCECPLLVRQWQPGDRFRPLGAPGSAKLQDLFVNRGVPPERRWVLPVVCSRQGEILWVPGFPPADGSKLEATSVTGLQLTYHTGTSTVRV
jgi:tRNA(Ile)-lysidine synthase